MAVVGVVTYCGGDDVVVVFIAGVVVVDDKVLVGVDRLLVLA